MEPISEPGSGGMGSGGLVNTGGLAATGGETATGGAAGTGGDARKNHSDAVNKNIQGIEDSLREVLEISENNSLDMAEERLTHLLETIEQLPELLQYKRVEIVRKCLQVLVLNSEDNIYASAIECISALRLIEYDEVAYDSWIKQKFRQLLIE